MPKQMLFSPRRILVYSQNMTVYDSILEFSVGYTKFLQNNTLYITIVTHNYEYQVESREGDEYIMHMLVYRIYCIFEN